MRSLEHGPLIAQRLEGLSLSTNTTRNFVLEDWGDTVGASDRPQRPACTPCLAVGRRPRRKATIKRSVSVLRTRSGHYSLGVPVGTYQINVGSEDFLDTTVEGVAVTQDTVLNITLDSGVLLEGKVVDDTGQPVPDAQVCLPKRVGEGFCTETESGGGFQLRVPPALYVQSRSARCSPSSRPGAGWRSAGKEWRTSC